MSDPKFCVNCKHHLVKRSEERAAVGADMCSRLANVVTGRRVLHHCIQMRDEEKFLLQPSCGLEARYFEPKYNE